MKDGLYHAELGIPQAALAQIRAGSFALAYTGHARHAAINDRFAQAVKMPRFLAVVPSEVFEVEVTRGVVSKFAVRLSSGFTASRADVDLVLVLVPTVRRDELAVKTLWFNERSDAHSTLDASKYVNPAA